MRIGWVGLGWVGLGWVGKGFGWGGEGSPVIVCMAYVYVRISIYQYNDVYTVRAGTMDVYACRCFRGKHT